jgi:putative peptide zinc metalloprotease protein
MTTLVDAPARVDGVQLIGEMVGSGYRTPPALVRRGDGQVLQLTPLLYLVLSAVDGRRSCGQVAELVGKRLGRTVTEADVRSLVDGHLRPLGLLKNADGSQVELRRSNPLLRIKPRVAVTDPATTRRLTDPFRVLFRPLVVAVLLAGFFAVVWWVFFDRGLGASAYDAFERPQLLLLVFVVSVLSGGMHEFGHAAATRYGGGQPGAMGAGLYLVWPAFYTDVTDSYRLDRFGRIRTDLGGLYFNAIVVVVTYVWWWATGWEALLLLVATQVLQMVQQMLPLLRFDGYHLLADLAGVPDLYQRIRPTLLGLLPHRWSSPENRMLKPSARALMSVWVLVTLPMMGLMLLAVVRAVPRLLGTAGSRLREDAAALGDAWSTGAPVDAAAHAVQLLGVALPVLACAMVLGRTGVRFVRGLARWSRGSAARRAVAALVAAAVVGGLAWMWWPDPHTYRPIQPGERGRLTAVLQGRQDLAGGAARAGSARPAQVMAMQQRLSSGPPPVAAFEKGGKLPTRDDPALAMVLLPRVDGAQGASAGAQDTDGFPAPDDKWVFPFDKPLPPAQGDNQALAVATTDGAVAYDVAFALVWATGDQVLNVNEAHAYASCTDCVAVAVAFQVVLVLDDARVIVPQNLAVAASYDCYRCITAAIAQQLVLSVGDDPDDQQLLALGAVWDRLVEFARTITSYSLTEVTDRLDDFEAEVVQILGSAPPLEPEPDTTTTLEPSPTPTAVPSPTASSTSGSLSPTGSPTTSSPSATGEGTSSSTTSAPDPTSTASATPDADAASPTDASP